MKHARVMIIALAVLLAGCATTKSYDYSAYAAHPPRSILVLPPVNDSIDVNAPYIYLSTISRPLAEHGYYVFPVAVVDAFMKQNGATQPAEMQNIPLHKLQEVFAPDAVLYTTINDWGQKYHLISSDTTVELTSRLVDADSGTTLWQGHERVIEGSGDNSNGLLAQAVVALVQQVAGSIQDYTHKAAIIANRRMIDDPRDGLPYGPYSPKAATDARRGGAVR